ncbi:hypothetical protein [Deinococcus sp. QL22]|uniref:hypothetical protein n=1 Tax=Deinococcus sp. QL22 TaxID=2939437 RepID=UPI0020173AE7|nr:hypothetical protein [Deinococcus sp. QL22]UQN05650.1 hypothetical protein M1R55_12330 [Deinococcus sp. QL22]
MPRLSACYAAGREATSMGLPFLVLFLGIMAYFARQQARLNRAMDSNDDSRREAGYVGPNVHGPTLI